MCRSQDLIGQRYGVGLADVGQVAALAVLGFALPTSVSGYFLLDATQERTAIRTAIKANRDRIDAVNVRISANSERLARIETLLKERLRPRQ